MKWQLQLCSILEGKFREGLERTKKIHISENWDLWLSKSRLFDWCSILFNPREKGDKIGWIHSEQDHWLSNQKRGNNMIEKTTQLATGYSPCMVTIVFNFIADRLHRIKMKSPQRTKKCGNTSTSFWQPQTNNFLIKMNWQIEKVEESNPKLA